ncbi:MAG: cytochrome C oxidase subunit IV family protein [Gemmatimonadaceae bacterium]
MSHPVSPGARPSHAHPNYVLIWVFLAALTALELFVAFIHWPKTVIILILVGMAFYKAALVGLYYMHLRFEPNRLRILALAPLPLFAVLVCAVITEFIW